LAGLEALQNLFNLLYKEGNTFSSFYELYKCAVEHVFGYKTNANANTNANTNAYANANVNANANARLGSFRAILAELEAFQISILNNIKVPTNKCYEHGFSSIRARMAELEPIENLEFSFSSFREPDKCDHIYKHLSMVWTRLEQYWLR
jgi:hypothetical protein